MKVFTTCFVLAFIFEVTMAKYLLVEIEDKAGHDLVEVEHNNGLSRTLNAGKRGSFLMYYRSV